MVFFHPNAFRAWSASMPQFDGTTLARKGAVIVTFDSRLGPLGYFAHPDLDAESPNHVSGNYGILDQLAALRWVQANIAAFGGDPARVTIFGQSDGGRAVGYMMVSPAAKGLFHRAIIQSSVLGAASAGSDATRTLTAIEEGTKQLVTDLGVTSIEALRSMPAAELVGRVNARPNAVGVLPVIDGWLLPRDIPEAIASGQQNIVDLIIGSTANEVRHLLPPTTPDGLRSRIEQRLGQQAGGLAALYYGTDPDTATAAQDRFGSDYFAAVARVVADLSARPGHPAWVYRFNRAAPGSDPANVGAFHCAELVYVFGTQNSIDRPWEAYDHELSELMSSYWVRFAETSSPNGPNLPEWPPYNSGSRKVKDFGTHPAPELLLESAPLIEAYLAKQVFIPK
jgi:para-nitrobenzyl esterase